MIEGLGGRGVDMLSNGVGLYFAEETFGHRQFERGNMREWKEGGEGGVRNMPSTWGASCCASPEEA